MNKKNLEKQNSIERIWNLKELQEMDEWVESHHNTWINFNSKHYITQNMIGKPVQWCIDQNCSVTDEMIAKTETELVQEAVSQANDKLTERLDKGDSIN